MDIEGKMNLVVVQVYIAQEHQGLKDSWCLNLLFILCFLKKEFIKKSVLSLIKTFQEYLKMILYLKLL